MHLLSIEQLTFLPVSLLHSGILIIVKGAETMNLSLLEQADVVRAVGEDLATEAVRFAGLHLTLINTVQMVNASTNTSLGSTVNLQESEENIIFFLALKER